jgi:trk system potassium uptake protein TrkA
MLKEMGVSPVIAKAASERHGKVLQRVGADRVIFPERDMAVRLAHHMVADNLVDLIELTSEVSIVEFRAPDVLEDTPLRDLQLRARYGVTVLAIRRADEVIAAPGGDDIIRRGDDIVAIGPHDQLVRVELLE